MNEVKDPLEKAADMSHGTVRKDSPSLDDTIPTDSIPLTEIIENYLEFGQSQKQLDVKTLRAYRIDLLQFSRQMGQAGLSAITSHDLELYIASLHQRYKPKTVKRKIASLRAFYHYLEYRDLIEKNPFAKLQIRFREPVTLPKTIPLPAVERFLSTIYRQRDSAKTIYQQRNALRDAAVCELLFATGIRISELCHLRPGDLNLYDHTVLVFGKGSKERKIQIGSEAVIHILTEYEEAFRSEIEACHHLFVNQSGRVFSDQAVRRMIRKYTSLAAIDQHITPHMFRHTFATALLEADVDIRYIQEILGHSSIHITEIYTHVTMSKQRDILTTKHPRKDFHI